MGLGSQIKHAWSTFTDKPNPNRLSNRSILEDSFGGGTVTTARPDRPKFRINSERTIISSIYTRMSIDVAAIRIEHCRTDDKDQYLRRPSSRDSMNV